MGNRKKLVITAISGNEEKWVKQWCESVLKANPDLIVMNLTQFDDNTEKLLREHIPKDKLILVKNKWEKSFSTARNQSLYHVPSWADYCMYVDMDEIITDTSYAPLEEFLMSDHPPIQILCNIYNAVSQDAMIASLYYPRIWPHKAMDGTLLNESFDGAVHNQLMIDDKYNIHALRSKINLFHYGYALDSASMAAKHKRSEELLRKQVEEDDNNFFAHLNLAQLLRAKGDQKGALKHSTHVLDLVTDKIEANAESKFSYAYIMAKDQVSTSYLASHNYKEAIKSAEDALKVKPDHLDSIMNIAHAYINSEDFENAEFWLKRYLFIRARYDETKDSTNLILNHLNSSFIALYHLGLVYTRKGDIEKALYYYKKSYEEDPKFKDTFVQYINCLKILNRDKQLNDEVNQFMRKVPEKAHQVYEYFGDIELENGNIENSKFNYYQAVYINNEESGNKQRIKEKWEALSSQFGDVSHNYFDTAAKNADLKSRITSIRR